MDAAFDELIAPLQARSTLRWQSLSPGDLIAMGDTGVTVALASNFINTATRGYVRYLRFDRLVVVSFNIGLTPSAATRRLDFLLSQFAVVGRAQGLGFDTNGHLLEVSLGTPAEVMTNTTLSASLSVLSVKKLDGTDFETFPVSAQGVIGQIFAEVSDVELT